MADALIRSIDVTIAGVTRTTCVVDQVYYSRPVNGIGQARFDTMDPAGSYAPAEGDSVIISLGGTVRWRGEVDVAETHFLGATGGLLTHVTATECAQYLQRDSFNTTFPAGTQKALLQALVAPGTVLATLGVTLDPAQPTGAALAEVAAPYMTPEGLLQYLSQITGDVYALDASLVLGMWAPGAKASGLTISLADGNLVDAQWTRHRFDYRNIEILSYGSPTTVQYLDDIFVGDGVTRIFPLRYVPAVAPAFVLVNGTGVPVGTYGVGGTVWTYRAADNSLYQDASAAVLTAADALTATLAVFFPQTVTYTDGAEVTLRGPWKRADSRPDLTTYAAAYAVAQALVEQNKPKPAVPVIVTTLDGILPGYTITVDLPAIGLASQLCLIQMVETTAVKSGDQADVQHKLTVVSGSDLVSLPRDIWRQFLYGGQTASLGSGAGSGGTIVPSDSTAVAAFSASLSTTTTEYGTNVSPNTALPVVQAIRRRLTAAQLAGISLQVRARVQSPEGGTVTLHLRNVTNGSSVGDSAATVLAAGVTTEITFRVVLSDGTADYELWWDATAAPISLGPAPGGVVLESL